MTRLATFLSTAILVFTTAPAPAADKNPGHLKMALVNLNAVYTDGPDPAANRVNLQANLQRHLDFIDHAGLYASEFDPPPGKDANTGWASGAWFIGPDGKTLAQMPSSTSRADSKEHVLMYNVPIPKR